MSRAPDLDLDQRAGAGTWHGPAGPVLLSYPALEAGASGQGQAPAWVEDLLAAVARARTTDVELRAPAVAGPDEVAALAALAEAQRERGYRLSLSLRLGPGLERAHLRVLGRAGLAHARLDPVTVTGDPHTTLLPTVRMLRLLAEATAAVSWALRLDEQAGVDDRGYGAFVDAVRHLPPPSGIVGPGGGIVPLGEAQAPPGAVAALRRWAGAYVPDLLTLSRGPGFVRLVDRRGGRTSRNGASVSKEQVVVLDGVQADVFLFLDEPRTLTEVAARFSGQVPAERLHEYLRLLAARGFVLHGGDRYLGLAVRRKVVGVG